MILVCRHPCHGHWCTTILSNIPSFAPWPDNSLDSLFFNSETWHLIFPKPNWSMASSDYSTCIHCLSFISDELMHRKLWCFYTELMYGFLSVQYNCGFKSYSRAYVADCSGFPCTWGLKHPKAVFIGVEKPIFYSKHQGWLGETLKIISFVLLFITLRFKY